jgi:hypothetical protein
VRNERLELEVAETLVRGVSILVWHAVKDMEDGATKDKQLRFLSEAEALARHLKTKKDMAL